MWIFFTKNRGDNIARGGSAIITDRRRGNFKTFEPFKTRFETVAAIGTVNGHTRKMLLVCSYMLPGLQGADDCLEEIAALVNEARVQFPNLLVAVGGDFNEFSPQISSQPTQT